MIVFIDSDILLDVLLVRQPYFGAAPEILETSPNKKVQCCTSVHSLLNTHYIAKKHYSEQATRQALLKLLLELQVVTEDSTIIHRALSSSFSDFEDAVQYYAATNVKADYIITRNLKDYRRSDIPVLTAEQFLIRL